MNKEKFLETLKQNKNILAIGIKGSFAYGYEDKYSDLDLLFGLRSILDN